MDFSEEAREKWSRTHPDLEFPESGRSPESHSEVIRVPKQEYRVVWGEETEDAVEVIIGRKKQ